MNNLTYQDIIKIIFAIVIILIIAIYPVLNIPIDEQIVQVFGTITVWLFGVATSVRNNNNA